MPFLLAFGVIGVAVIQTSGAHQRADAVFVRTVIDGDTIDVTMTGRVRLLGIDAPEMGRGFDTAAPFAREARARLAALVLHRWIRLEPDGPRRDVYGRSLAYVVREDGVFINAVLVHWTCEAGAPGALSRRGFKKGDLRLGDTLIVDGYLAKDGSHLMDARRVTLPDGRIVSGASAGDGGPQ